MINEMSYGFPAGDESDGSGDDWDIGFSKPCAEVNLIASYVNPATFAPCVVKCNLPRLIVLNSL